MLSLTLVISVLLLTAFGADAVTHASPSPTPTQVRAGIYLVNLQKFDLSTGTYDVDFYMWFIWSGNMTTNYEFMNGKTSSIDIIERREGFLDVRVRGTFLKNLNFKSYPFDTHRLTIEIEDKNLPIEELEFVPDDEESGIDMRSTWRDGISRNGRSRLSSMTIRET